MNSQMNSIEEKTMARGGRQAYRRARRINADAAAAWISASAQVVGGAAYATAQALTAGRGRGRRLALAVLQRRYERGLLARDLGLE